MSVVKEEWSEGYSLGNVIAKTGELGGGDEEGGRSVTGRWGIGGGCGAHEKDPQGFWEPRDRAHTRGEGINGIDLLEVNPRF